MDFASTILRFLQLEYNRGNPASGVRGRTPDKTRQDKGSIRPLAWGTVYCASNCTDFSNFIFAIKQGGLEKTLEV